MPQQRSTMIYPPIEDLLEAAGSKFTLVTLAAKRGRQINAYFNQLGEGLGSIVPPQVASIARKPLTIALEEIATGKVLPAYDEEDAGTADSEVLVEDSEIAEELYSEDILANIEANIETDDSDIEVLVDDQDVDDTNIPKDAG